MPQEPKKRHSRQRKGKRRASIHMSAPKPVVCKNCGSMTLSHIVCKNCGYYGGKEVLATRKKEKGKEEKPTDENLS